MPGPRSAGADQPNAQAQLRGFIAKFDAANQKLIRTVRRKLRRRYPAAFELVYDNYNFFVIGYSPTPRPSDAIVSITANSAGVGVCFVRGASLPDPGKVLQGSGNQTRFIRVPTPEVLDSRAVVALLTAAEKQSKAPFGKAGSGELVIRSVSGKQRPRRREP